MTTGLKNILIIDDEENMRHSLSLIIEQKGYEVFTIQNGEKALNILSSKNFDLILCDIRMPEMDGITFLKEFHRNNYKSTVIMMSAYGNIDTAIEAIKLGAYDYISKPFKTDEIILTIKKAEERERLKRENIRLKEEIHEKYSFENIITRSSKMNEIFSTIKKSAPYKLSILLTGESGTGKELFAKAIHYNSSRSKQPFVAVNCGAIPNELLENEFFGHAKGSFTGAVSSKKGLFEEADKGTIFLDEIGELPFNLQVKLLRVLQEENIRRIGENKTIPVDVRVIAATAKDIKKEIEKKLFREDLFFRLNVVSVHIPPLRERKGDISLLTDHFIAKYDDKEKKIKSVSSELLKQLFNYSWPGNIRELENIIQRSIIMNESGILNPNDLPPDFNKQEKPVLPYAEAFQLFEKEIISNALLKAAGNRTEAAKLLGISYRSLMYKLKEHELQHIDDNKLIG